jgi:hypothetical protein
MILLLLSLHRVRALQREALMTIVTTAAVLAVVRGGVMALPISKAVATPTMLLMLYQRYTICSIVFHHLTYRSMSSTLM